MALTALEAAMLLACEPQETEFHERLLLIQRMNGDEAFANEVVLNFKPSYYWFMLKFLKDLT